MAIESLNQLLDYIEQSESLSFFVVSYLDDKHHNLHSSFIELFNMVVTWKGIV